MSARDCLPVALFITRRKLASAKASAVLLAGFLFLLALFWVKGDFILSFRLFLFLFPYFFLFLARDMIKDEVDSGALENLLFLDGRFRGYLLWKNAVIAAAALALGLSLLSVYSFYGLATHRFFVLSFLQFGTGIIAGLYYLALAGFLSFFLKAGTNVLLVILGQFLAFFGLLVSAAQRPEWVERLTSSSSPGLAAQLEFLALAVVIPNIIIVRGFWLSVLGLGALTGFLFGLQLTKTGSLELRK
jgi:hypothetical protein